MGNKLDLIPGELTWTPTVQDGLRYCFFIGCGYNALDSLFVNFENKCNPFTGDFLVSVDSGFSNVTLHTNNPYQNNHEHIALLQNPIHISDSLL